MQYWTIKERKYNQIFHFCEQEYIEWTLDKHYLENRFFWLRLLCFLVHRTTKTYCFMYLCIYVFRNTWQFIKTIFTFAFDIYIAGEQLLYTWPQIYDSSLPDSFVKRNPNVALAVNNRHVQKRPLRSLKILTSLDGQKFLSFAKFGKFG